jgi:hypothetical protein
MNDERMSDHRLHKLLFDVRRSLRYHDRRRAFFDRMHQITAGLTVLLAGSVLFELARPGETAPWMIALAVAAALLSSWDIVVSYASKAGLHRDLKIRFGALEMAILAGDETYEAWQHHHLDRLRIEQDEPPVFRALDLLCHNELLVAEGFKRNDEKDKEEFARLNGWQRATRHLFHWADLA